ncbi:MAG: hypothetical protein WC756_18660 [Taibaiella sp.]|jgi:hypothetical protein
MKQSLLILAAATAVAFAACNGGNNEGSYTQAQVDSMAKVQSDSIAAAMKAQTDSTIAATAAAEARSADSLRVIDSIIAATKKTTTTTVVKKTGGKKGTTTTTTKEETKVEPKPTKQDDKFNNRINGTKTISEEKAKSQDDKFNRRSGN